MRKYRTFLPTAVGNILQKITPKLIPQKSYMIGTIIHDWPTIVGDDFAALTHPYKVSFAKGTSTHGTLYLSVRDNSTSMMIHHHQGILLDKVNRYLGYTALSQITPRIGMRSTASPHKKTTYRQLSSTENEAIAQTLQDLPEGALKESLRQLGTTLWETTK